MRGMSSSAKAMFASQAAAKACTSASALLERRGIFSLSHWERAGVRENVSFQDELNSSWHGHFLQQFLDHLVYRDPFDFEFGAQDEPMFEHRIRHGLDVVRRDEIAPGNRGESATGEQQRLRGARPGAGPVTASTEGWAF